MDSFGSASQPGELHDLPANCRYMHYEVIYEQAGKHIVRRYRAEFVIDNETALAHIQRGLRVYNGFLQKHEAPRKAIRFRLLSDKWEPPSYEKVTFANR